MRGRSFRQMVSVHLEENRSLYLFTILLFTIGIIFGAIVVNSLSFSQKNDLYMYLQQFFGQVSEGKLASGQVVFSKSFAHYAKYIGLIWLLGLSIIGLPMIFVLLFLKGLVVGFTVGFLVNQMGATGFFLAFVSVLPQNLLLVPSFIIVGTAAVSFCLKLIRHQFIKKANEPIFPMFLRYSFLILCIGAVIAVASAIEAFFSPTLMKWILNLF